MRLVDYRALITLPLGTLFQRVSIERSAERQIYALLAVPTQPGEKVKVSTPHSTSLYSFQYLNGVADVGLTLTHQKDVIREGTLDPEAAFYSADTRVAELDFCAGDHYLVYEKDDLVLLRAYIDAALDGKAHRATVECDPQRAVALRTRAMTPR